MFDEKANKKALEDAARAVHENYYGVRTWKAAGPKERSHARHSIRLMAASLEKHGLSFMRGAPGLRPPAPPRPR